MSQKSGPFLLRHLTANDKYATNHPGITDLFLLSATLYTVGTICMITDKSITQKQRRISRDSFQYHWRC